VRLLWESTCFGGLSDENSFLRDGAVLNMRAMKWKTVEMEETGPGHVAFHSEGGYIQGMSSTTQHFLCSYSGKPRYPVFPGLASARRNPGHSMCACNSSSQSSSGVEEWRADSTAERTLTYWNWIPKVCKNHFGEPKRQQCQAGELQNMSADRNATLSQSKALALFTQRMRQIRGKP
jgi:hypothetical protein